MEELGIFRPSGLHRERRSPGRTAEKSIALDNNQDLADILQLGPKFYLIGFSTGGEIMPQLHPTQVWYWYSAVGCLFSSL
jgi:hypothetical protein